MMKRGEVHALVLHDDRSPVAVLLLPVAVITDELLAALQRVAEDYEQFVLSAPQYQCQNLDEACASIRAYNGNATLADPGKHPL